MQQDLNSPVEGEKEDQEQKQEGGVWKRTQVLSSQRQEMPVKLVWAE